MRLIQSIKMEESDIGAMAKLFEDLATRHGKNAKIFWHSERFSSDCYLAVYEDNDDDSVT